MATTGTEGGYSESTTAITDADNAESATDGERRSLQRSTRAPSHAHTTRSGHRDA